jgi:hypothetical protein
LGVSVERTTYGWDRTILRRNRAESKDRFTEVGRFSSATMN